MITLKKVLLLSAVLVSPALASIALADEGSGWYTREQATNGH